MKCRFRSKCRHYNKDHPYCNHETAESEVMCGYYKKIVRLMIK
jgi:hypothetical protein